MRANVKEQLLQEYRDEKEAHIEKIRVDREQQLEEEVYREKIRDKIEKEMRMDAIERTKKELEKREQNRYEMKSKLDEFKNYIEHQVAFKKDVANDKLDS